MARIPEAVRQAVLEDLKAGKSTRQIAAARGIATGSVSTIRRQAGMPAEPKPKPLQPVPPATPGGGRTEFRPPARSSERATPPERSSERVNPGETGVQVNAQVNAERAPEH